MLRVAPLFPVAVGLIAGIAADHQWQLPPAAYLAVGAILSATAVLALYGLRVGSEHRLPRFARRDTLLAGLLLGLSFNAGGLLYWSSARCTATKSVARIATKDGVLVRLRGRIVTPPQILEAPPNPFAQWIPQSQRTAFVLAAEGVESDTGFVTVGGRVRVTAYEAVLGLSIGEPCEIYGRLRGLAPPVNPGAFDWRMYSLTQGIVAQMTCQHRENVRPLAGSPQRLPGSVVCWLRRQATRLLVDDLPATGDEAAGLLESMLLGQRSAASVELNDVFVRSGCIHYLSVSGIHLVIVMFLARLLCQGIGASRHSTSWIMMFSVILYAVLAEPRPPILRAAVIGVVYCVARLIGRERSYLNWTSLAAVVLLMVNPLWLLDVGFQLSFAAVLGVAYLTPAVESTVRDGWGSAVRLMRLGDGKYAEQDRIMREHAAAMSGRHPRPAKQMLRWCGRQVIGGLAVSVAASLAGLPIVALHFYRVQPWSPLSSTVLMLPVTALMALGILKLAVGAISPFFGGFVAVLLQWCESVVMRLVEWLAALPGASIPAPVVPWWVHLGFFVCMTLWALRARERAAQAALPTPKPVQATYLRLPRFSSRLGFAALTIIAFTGAVHQTANRGLRITFLAVGRGSTTVIELPGGEALLYDAGASFSSDPGRNVIAPFLLSRGIHRINKLHISHPNLDHFSGVPTLIDQIETGAVVINECFESRVRPDSPSDALLKMLEEAGTSIERLSPSSKTWQSGEVKFELLWPALCDWEASVNDTSTVLRISLGSYSLLLTGDIDETAQEALLAQGDLKADVLVLPHHGSVRRTTRRFIEAVGADVLIRSSDERMSDTINGLVQITEGRQVYNTADIGAVTVEMVDAGVKIHGMRGEVPP